MKIRWKFLEDKEEIDKYGNLKSYYRESEPWKKPRPRPNYFLQVLKIIIALAVFGIIVLIALSFQPYDWNEAGIIRIIRDTIHQRGWI